MPTIDISGLPVDTVNRYPDPFWKAVVGRERKRLGNAVGLTQFGVNLTTLKPAAERGAVDRGYPGLAVGFQPPIKLRQLAAFGEKFGDGGFLAFGAGHLRKDSAQAFEHG